MVLTIGFSGVAMAEEQQFMSLEPPELVGTAMGVLSSVVASDSETPKNMVLTTVTGVPDTLMIAVKSGDETLAVVKGNEILYSMPFEVEQSKKVELHLAGSGLPVKTKLIFEPVQELWGTLNINILPDNSEITGQLNINILPPGNEGELSGDIEIKFINNGGM
jgi:hypothetical protein